MGDGVAPTMSPEMLRYAKALFDEVTANEDGIDSFCRAQGITRSEYDDICPDANAKDLDRFVHYLSSASADAMKPPIVDTSYPLSDYYVSSSHNTYLWGNQLYGKASADSYRNVLTRGCRSVEIDVWDGDDSDSDISSSESDDEQDGQEHKSRMDRLSKKFKKEVSFLKTRVEGPPDHPVPTVPHEKPKSIARSLKREPRVLHGYTATKEVPFRTVCKSIRQHAFSTSDLPIVVSLEVHTSPQQQKIMVEIMKEEWSSYLGDLSIDVNDDTPLPTLDSLRNRILIKVKYTAPEKVSKKVAASGADVEGESSDGEEQADAVQKGHIIPELGCMGIYMRSYHFKSFDQPEAKVPTHIFSLSEKKLLEFCKSNASAMFNHNKRYLMRAYPKGLRVTSSNLDPVPFWRHGVQMVALNWQYINAAMMLNQAMFHSTGGWALKPEGYRSRDDASCPKTALHRGTLDLRIELLAGQSIGPDGEHLKLYVRCELHIEDSDEDGGDLKEAGQSKEGQIKAHSEVARGGTNPDFQRQILRFDAVPDVADELTFVRFKIMDDETLGRDDLIAWACFRLSRLQQGVRLIRLYDPEGQPTEGALLVRIHKAIRAA